MILCFRHAIIPAAAAAAAAAKEAAAKAAGAPGPTANQVLSAAQQLAKRAPK